MSRLSENLVRWGALASIAGGVLWSAKVILDGYAASSLSGITDALFVVAPLLMLAGLGAFHARYAERIRGMGRTGFVNAFIGLALLIGGFMAELTLGMEEATRVSSFGFLILAFGLVLLGLEVMKVEPLPRWNFLPLTMGLLVPLSVVAGEDALLRVALSAVFGLGWAMLGYALWSDTGREEARVA